MSIKILASKTFKKHYQKRITKPSLKKRYKERVILFKADPTNAILQDHKLIGEMEGKRAFSITGDIRVVYRELDEETVEFLDIGTHPQVYGE